MEVVVTMNNGETQQIPAAKAVPLIAFLQPLRNQNLRSRTAGMDLVVDRNFKAPSLKSTV